MIDILLQRRLIARYDQCYRSITGSKYFKLKTSPRNLTLLKKLVQVANKLGIEPEQYIIIQFTRIRREINRDRRKIIHVGLSNMIGEQAEVQAYDVIMPDPHEVDVDKWVIRQVQMMAEANGVTVAEFEKAFPFIQQVFRVNA